MFGSLNALDSESENVVCRYLNYFCLVSDSEGEHIVCRNVNYFHSMNDSEGENLVCHYLNFFCPVSQCLNKLKVNVTLKTRS